MFGPITKEESLRHLRNALELEMEGSTRPRLWLSVGLG